PVLPYGGGSGLMGGALSVRAGMVIDLRTMNRILEIDTGARSARVQTGVVLKSLEKRLNQDGFILDHDPWTVPVATVGGAISTNSMGYRAGAYGSMGEQYLGFEGIREVVTAEEKLALSICSQGGGKKLPSEAAERFWNDRHVIARRFMQNRRQRRGRGRDGVYRDWIHVALPGSKILPFRT